MAAKDFDPKKFIDRTFETELFENLLQLKDLTRILAIQDKGGMGKSQLLAKLEYRCRTVRPRTPVSLIALDQLENPSPLGLVRQVVVDLERMEIKFPRFMFFNTALISGNFNPFQAVIDARGASFIGASNVRFTTANVYLEKVEGDVKVENTTRSPLTPEQQKVAEEECITVFFDELKSNAVKSNIDTPPIVIMLDAYEKCEQKLRAWIEGSLLDRYFFNFNQRPEQFLLVVAGREIPAFERWWGSEDISTVVTSVNELGKWTRVHVEECLKVNGYIYTDANIDTFFNLVEMGLAPSVVVNLMDTLLARQT